MFHDFVLVWRPVGNRKTRKIAGLKVAATWGWLLGPENPHRGAREPPRDNPNEQKWDSRPGGAHVLQNRHHMMKNNVFINVHAVVARNRLGKPRAHPSVDTDGAQDVLGSFDESGPREPKRNKMRTRACSRASQK